MATFKSLTANWSVGSSWDTGVVPSGTGSTATFSNINSHAMVDGSPGNVGTLGISAGTIDIVSASTTLTAKTLSQTGGVINVNAGTLYTTGTLTQGAGALDIGAGTLRTNTIAQTGGNIVFTGAGTLEIDAYETSAVTVDLGTLAVHGTILWNFIDKTTAHLTLKNFLSGDALRVTVGTASTAGLKLTYAGSATAGTVTISDTLGTVGIVNVSDPTGGLAQSAFSVKTVGSGASTYVELDTTVPCFLRGTRIATARGEVAVEDLRIGDLVVTTFGCSQPVTWIGTRAYVTSLLPEDVRAGLLPVRIAAGALGEGRPVRDLFVSPEHMMCIGDVLVPARKLLNGTTITRAERFDVVRYFHVELPRHSVILAEGAPAESFLDTGNRNMFGNVLDYLARGISPDAPRQAPCLPVVTGGAALEAVRAALAACAADLRAIAAPPVPVACCPARLVA